MPMVLNNSGDSPYWEYKPSPEEQAAFDQQFFSGLDPNGWHLGPNTGPKNFMERLVAYGAPLALGAMAAYAGPEMYAAMAGGGGAGAGLGAGSTILGDVVPAAGTVGYGATPGIEGLLGGAAAGGAGGAAAGTLPLSGSIPELPWASTLTGNSTIPLGAAGGALPGLGTLAPEAAGLWSGFGAASSLPWGDLPINADVAGTGNYDIIQRIKDLTTNMGLDPSKMKSILGPTASLLGGGGSQSSTGSLLGGLLGAGLGYLDARNQPDNITVTRTMDPKLAPYAYSAAGSANDLLNQQITGSNPLTQAGQQISGMSALPGWGSLVDTSKSQWDSNPWVQQQQKAITDLMTRNLKENVFSGVDDQANMASGYGGSKNAQALGLAASRMNTDLGPALANLASSAYESSQNRALAGAQGAANYGLNNQRQQADIWNLGANLQANGPWNPYSNFSTLLNRFNGNSGTEITPLFTNVGSNVLGGTALGSLAGGSVNWNDLLKNIGGILGGVGGWFNNKG